MAALRTSAKALGYFALLFGSLLACSAEDRRSGLEDERGKFVGDGGGAGDASDTCATAEAVAQKPPVDVILSIDESGSMMEEAYSLRENLNRLSTFLESTNLDYRIILIGRSVCIPPPLAGPDCQSKGRFLAVRDEVQSTDTLEIVLRSLERPPGVGGAWKDFLRPEALKVFIPITDDESRLAAESFDQMLLQKPGGLFGTTEARRYRFYPVVGAEAYPSKARCSSAMKTGDVYLTLAELTSGKWFSVCDLDFEPVFDSMGRDIAATVACDLPLPSPDGGGEIDLGRVNAAILPSDGAAPITIAQDRSKACHDGADGWQYNADHTRIVLCGSACEKLRADNGARLVVEFGCATRVR